MKEKYDTYFEKLLKDVSGGNAFGYIYRLHRHESNIYFLFDSINKYFFYLTVWDLYVKYHYKIRYRNEAEIK